jgi:hypothetical protein
VRSETSTWPGSAACSIRAAALTASPVASASPGRGAVTAMTEPVLMPMRSSSATPYRSPISSFSSPSRLRMRRAARSARAGSSSCTCGTPNAAMTASPMNFSTVPPSASISARMAAKNAPMTSFSRSASSRSPRAVEPVMSANRTVTTLRSSRAAAGTRASSRPQPLQKRASSGFSRPQRSQVGTPEAYGRVART